MAAAEEKPHFVEPPVFWASAERLAYLRNRATPEFLAAAGIPSDEIVPVPEETLNLVWGATFFTDLANFQPKAREEEILRRSFPTGRFGLPWSTNWGERLEDKVAFLRTHATPAFLAAHHIPDKIDNKKKTKESIEEAMSAVFGSLGNFTEAALQEERARQLAEAAQQLAEDPWRCIPYPSEFYTAYVKRTLLPNATTITNVPVPPMTNKQQLYDYVRNNASKEFLAYFSMPNAPPAAYYGNDVFNFLWSILTSTPGYFSEETLAQVGKVAASAAADSAASTDSVRAMARQTMERQAAAGLPLPDGWLESTVKYVLDGQPKRDNVSQGTFYGYKSVKDLFDEIRPRANAEFLTRHEAALTAAAGDWEPAFQITDSLYARQEFNLTWLQGVLDERVDAALPERAREREAAKVRPAQEAVERAHEPLLLAAAVGDLAALERAREGTITLDGIGPMTGTYYNVFTPNAGTPGASRVPLYVAVSHDHVEAVAWLLDHGANVNRLCGADADGQYASTPLTCAAGRGNEAIFDLLVARGADMAWCDFDPGHDDDYGQNDRRAVIYTSVLLCAARAGSARMVSRIIAAGCRGPEMRDSITDGNAAWREQAAAGAEEKGHSEVAKLIRSWRTPETAGAGAAAAATDGIGAAEHHEEAHKKKKKHHH